MCKELLMLNLNRNTGEVTEISSFDLMIEAFAKMRDEIKAQNIKTTLDQDRLTMLHFMIEDAVFLRGNKELA